jgi:hypothetical protein
MGFEWKKLLRIDSSHVNIYIILYLYASIPRSKSNGRFAPVSYECVFACFNKPFAKFNYVLLPVTEEILGEMRDCEEAIRRRKSTTDP